MKKKLDKSRLNHQGANYKAVFSFVLGFLSYINGIAHHNIDAVETLQKNGTMNNLDVFAVYLMIAVLGIFAVILGFISRKKSKTILSILGIISGVIGFMCSVFLIINQ